jgi:hypothetical protein
MGLVSSMSAMVGGRAARIPLGGVAAAAVVVGGLRMRVDGTLLLALVMRYCFPQGRIKGDVDVGAGAMFP